MCPFSWSTMFEMEIKEEELLFLIDTHFYVECGKKIENPIKNIAKDSCYILQKLIQFELKQLRSDFTLLLIGKEFGWAIEMVGWY